MNKILTLCGAMLFATACSRDPEDRGTTYMPNMVYSVATEAYSESEVTADGKGMMMPVEGTIARGKMPYHYGNTEEEAVRAGVELVDPNPETDESKARGQEVYSQFCFPCHGAKAEGDGPVVLKKFPAPPSFKSERVMAFSKGRIFHVITNGYQNMPSHAAQVLERDRWYVAQYIKEFQTKN